MYVFKITLEIPGHFICIYYLQPISHNSQDRVYTFVFEHLCDMFVHSLLVEHLSRNKINDDG